MSLPSKIEAVLFWKAEPMTIRRISEALGESEEEIEKALSSLETSYENRGFTLIRKDSAVTLATAPKYASLIEGLAKDELSRDIGKAGLETLSIILYYGPISRREVDYIRGVNSAFIVRHLLVRGLVEREEDKKDQRVYLYKPTFDLLAFLGISKLENLPDYLKIRGEFDAFVAARDKMNEEVKDEEENVD